MKKQLHLLSAIELSKAFKQGEVLARDIAHFFLERIEQANPTLKAFINPLTKRTLEKAEILDHKRARNKPLGKLAAVPIAIKDNQHIAGEFTTCASKFLTNYKAPFDATACHLLDQEDALLIGKTNLDEFAMGSSTEYSAFSPCRNPWNLECVPGGSSGGSAAAVSARLSLLATGSDTGGSIRQPASFSGIVGFKPTYGRVSRFGLVAFGSSLDHIGPMATCVSDAALAMEVIGRHCPNDSTSLDTPQEFYLETFKKDLKGVTFGVPWNFLETLSPEMCAHFTTSLDRLKDLGAQLTTIDLDICKYSIAIYSILSCAEASTNLARFDGIRYGKRWHNVKTLEEVYECSRKEGFGHEVKKRILLGTYILSSSYDNPLYKKAQKARTLLINAFDEAFTKCNAITLPTSPTGAFPLHSISDPISMYLQDMFTVPANLAGLPAISVPSGFDTKGMPLGLQFIGPQLQDVPVMRYGYAFEQTVNLNNLPPAFKTP